MRMLLLSVTGLIVLLLQGCATAPASANQGLASLKLFGSDSQPRFVAYLACSPKSQDSIPQCRTAENAFDAWATARGVRLQRVDKDDAIFRTGKASSKPHADKPYALAIEFEPEVVPSFDTWHGTWDGSSSGYIPGRAGYDATIYVFDAASGALLASTSMHDQQRMPPKGDVTPVIRADVRTMIRRIDPAFSHS